MEKLLEFLLHLGKTGKLGAVLVLLSCQVGFASGVVYVYDRWILGPNQERESLIADAQAKALISSMEGLKQSMDKYGDSLEKTNASVLDLYKIMPNGK